MHGLRHGTASAFHTNTTVQPLASPHFLHLLSPVLLLGKAEYADAQASRLYIQAVSSTDSLSSGDGAFYSHCSTLERRGLSKLVHLRSAGISPNLGLGKQDTDGDTVCVLGSCKVNP